MSLFKRISATLTSRVDQMVSEIENHDAVVETAIKESRRSTAQAKVRMARVQKDIEHLRNKMAELQHNETQWQSRARKLAGENDETQAIECLRRSKICCQQKLQAEQALAQHESLATRLRQDIRQAEQKLAQMNQQRNLMRTRQATAEALNAMSITEEASTIDAAQAFERWEAKVIESELEIGTLDTHESFEQQFLDEEEKSALRAELQDLLAEEGRDNV